MKVGCKEGCAEDLVLNKVILVWCSDVLGVEVMTGEELLKRYAAGERDFRGVDLTRVKIPNVDLSGADLSGAILDSVDLTGAKLHNVKMRGATATSGWAEFSGTDFTGADLTGADLNQSHAYGAIYKNAILDWARSPVVEGGFYENTNIGGGRIIKGPRWK